METLHLLATIIYFTMLIGLAGYGLHRHLMIFLYFKHRRHTPKPLGVFDFLPRLTVQLPLYNEQYVAERLLDSVTALDYPRDRIEFQVLDDSIDETQEIVERKVRHLRARGFTIEHIRRPDRTGYKAGALHYGLQRATGEFIAIFDADFLPQPDLLQKIIHFFTDPKIGMIQTRWGHLNGQYSLLTRVQSMFLDGHFLIEQTARSRSGRFFNFNGTAGIWRRSCIESSGGWQADTLAEDLDLSYRAQISGWRFLFLPDIVTPAELPVEINAFKTQQHRWTKGSIQTCKKTLPLLWRSPLPLKIKIEGTIHLTSNFGYLMLLLLCLCFHGSASVGTGYVTGGNVWTKMILVDLPLFLAASVSVIAFYVCAQREMHVRWYRRLVYVPLLMAVGIGLSVNNARAVLEAIFNHRSEFIRTPKLGGKRCRGLRGEYRTIRGMVPYLELALGGYFTVLLLHAVENAQWAAVPFLVIFQAGFLFVGILSLMQGSFPFLKPTAPPQLTPAGA